MLAFGKIFVSPVLENWTKTKRVVLVYLKGGH